MRSQSGISLLELLFAAGSLALAAAVTVPQVLVSLDDFRAIGAARYLSSRLQETRMEAVTRSANAALRFTRDGTAYGFAVYEDGNGNGVLSRDIQRGIDREIRPTEQLSVLFPGVDFGALPGLPPVEGSGTPPGSNPIRFGASDMVSFTAHGTSTSGSVYIQGRRTSQYVVRVFGDTGRTRVLKFDGRSRTWRQL
jgi:hypothetical protein